MPYRRGRETTQPIHRHQRRTTTSIPGFCHPLTGSRAKKTVMNLYRNRTPNPPPLAPRQTTRRPQYLWKRVQAGPEHGPHPWRRLRIPRIQAPTAAAAAPTQNRRQRPGPAPSSPRSPSRARAAHGAPANRRRRSPSYPPHPTAERGSPGRRVHPSAASFVRPRPTGRGKVAAAAAVVVGPAATPPTERPAGRRRGRRGGGHVRGRATAAAVPPAPARLPQAGGLVGEDRVEVGPRALVGATPHGREGPRDREGEGQRPAGLFGRWRGRAKGVRRWVTYIYWRMYEECILCTIDVCVCCCENI